MTNRNYKNLTNRNNKIPHRRDRKWWLMSIAWIFTVIATTASMLMPCNSSIGVCVSIVLVWSCLFWTTFGRGSFKLLKPDDALNPARCEASLGVALMWWVKGCSAVRRFRLKGGDGNQRASSLRCHRVNKGGELLLCISAQRVWSWLVTIILPRAVWLPASLLPN